MREIPLKIVRDTIASPPREETVTFPGGTVRLPGGNHFQVSAGTITFTWDASSLVITAAQTKELADRVQAMIDLVKAGTLDTMSFKMAAENGALSANPAEPA